MKTKMIAMLTLTLALAAQALAGPAVPQGKAAVAEAVVGSVSRLAHDSNDKKALKLGAVLDYGDRIITGPNGRVSLRQAGNALSRLAPNTELSLDEPGKRKGVFLTLKSGFLRFLVGKREAGESFEVSTANAVAAVKGTDGTVETDGKTTSSSVIDSDHKNAMEVIDRDSGKKESLDPGQITVLDEDGFKTRDLTKDEKQTFEDHFKELPAAKLLDQVEKEKPAEGAPVESAEAKTEAQEALAGEVSNAFESVMNDLQTDSFMERDERTGDLVAGRIVYDRNGDRTQVSSYIVRPQPDQVEKASYAKRETGPFTGTSFAIEDSWWNQALPDDWYDVIKLSLDEQAYAWGAPVYWRTAQEFIAGNPQGDSMQVSTTFLSPAMAAMYDITISDYVPAGYTQPYSASLYLNGADALDWGLNMGSLAVSQAYPNVAMYYVSYKANWSSLVSAQGDGSLQFDYSRYDPQNMSQLLPPFLTAQYRLLDSDGTAWDLTDFAGPSALASDLRGFPSQLNLEVTFNCPNFSAPIDLMFIPDVFDQMDMFMLPVATSAPAL